MYKPDDKYSKLGIIGERAVRNALENYRLNDYLYCHERLKNREMSENEYQQGGGLDARRELVYYTVYSTREDKNLQKMEIDLIEEWMYADDKKPHKKAHEVKGELASIQGGQRPQNGADKLEFLVSAYKPNTKNGDKIQEARKLQGTGNLFIETKQGNGPGWACIIRDTAEELKKNGFDEGRDVWSAGIVWNNREIWEKMPEEQVIPGQPLNNLIMLAIPQEFIIEGINGKFQEAGIAKKANGYAVPFEMIYPLKEFKKYCEKSSRVEDDGEKNSEDVRVIWGVPTKTGVRLYEDQGILASFKGYEEEWDESDYEIKPVIWPPMEGEDG